MTTIKEWQKQVYAVAKEKGWHDEGKDKSFGECIALVHSELSEALEEYRSGRETTWYAEDGKPEGIDIELADAVIRIMDMCEQFGIDLQSAMMVKHEFNKTRSYRHGNKKI